MTRHVQAKHIPKTSLKKFKCNECEKTFTRSDTLYKHQSNIHFTSAKNLDFVSEKVKPYSCEFCLASFKTAWHLKRHKEKCQNSNPSRDPK